MDLHLLKVAFLHLLVHYIPVYGERNITVYEGENFVIPWTYDYPSDWERQSTYWRYWNSTIEKSKKVTLMFKSGLGQVTTNKDYITNGRLVEDKETVAGMVYHNVHLYDSGYYELTMDFLNQPSYVDTVNVTVTQKRDEDSYTQSDGKDIGSTSAAMIGHICGMAFLAVAVIPVLM